MGVIQGAIARLAGGRVVADSRPAAPTGDAGLASFAELVYELLDAHADTAQLACRLPLDDAWLAHLEYLRALQRQGRGILAHLNAEPTG